MSGPVLVEATRGGIVESRHRGSVAVVDTDGTVVLALGDVEQAVLPRSAVKAFQALPLVTSGAADGFGFDDRALALACASHTGEADHVEHVTATLAAIGLSVDDLACGAHWPAGAAATRALALAGGEPTAAHNNCSGKHTGFLAAASHARRPDRGLHGRRSPGAGRGPVGDRGRLRHPAGPAGGRRLLGPDLADPPPGAGPRLRPLRHRDRALRRRGRGRRPPPGRGRRRIRSTSAGPDASTPS